MKHTNGVPHNIKDVILGKITKKRKSVFNRKNYILVSDEIESVPSGYMAVITSRPSLSTTKPYISEVPLIEDFNEGDVVSISRDGEIMFVYEIAAKSNAIFATGKCNHRCIMCPQPPVIEEDDRMDFNMKLISLLDKSTKDVGITGGEPTLLGEKLFDMIRHIKIQLPKASISILSNGVRFADKNYALKLAACNCCDLQIDIPMFSDIAELHNEIVGAKTFYKTVQGLYNLAFYGNRVAIRVVIHKKTYKRLPQLADYIYHNFPFVTQVAFMQMETIGLAEENISELWIDPYDYNSELEKAVKLLVSRGIHAMVYNAQLCVLPQSLHDNAVQSISEWKDIYLDECEECKLKQSCPGLFESNKKYHSKHIKSIS